MSYGRKGKVGGLIIKDEDENDGGVREIRKCKQDK